MCQIFRQLVYLNFYAKRSQSKIHMIESIFTFAQESKFETRVESLIAQFKGCEFVSAAIPPRRRRPTAKVDDDGNGKGESGMRNSRRKESRARAAAAASVVGRRSSRARFEETNRVKRDSKVAKKRQIIPGGGAPAGGDMPPAPVTATHQQRSVAIRCFSRTNFHFNEWSHRECRPTAYDRFSLSARATPSQNSANQLPNCYTFVSISALELAKIASILLNYVVYILRNENYGMKSSALRQF